MPRRLDVEKLALENRALRDENRRLRREGAAMRRRLARLGVRVEALRRRQVELSGAGERAEGLLRWLRARLEALEREVEGHGG